MQAKTFFGSFFLVVFILGIHCRKKETQNPFTEKYFLTARVNGILWRTEGIGNARFSAEYIHPSEFSINIHAHSQDPDPVATGIVFDFDFVPKPGRYFFNNVGMNQLDSGIIAIYSYYNINRVSSKWSNSGYIDIEYISIEEARGSFSFTAIGDATNPEMTTITGGTFKVIYGGSSGAIWPGP